MAKTTEKSSLEEAARACYQWYTEPSFDASGVKTLQGLLGSPISQQDLQRMSEKLRRSGDFERQRRSMMARWQHQFATQGELDDAAAQEFLREMFEQFDHNLLFEQGITASTTRIERGQVADIDTYYPGNMPCWTIHLTSHGSALFLNDNMEKDVAPGDLMLFRPEAQYHCGLHPGAREWRHYWALFQPRSHWGDLLEWQPLDAGIYHLRLPDSAVLAQMKIIFEELLALRNDNSPYQGDLQYNKLEELLLRAKCQVHLRSEVLDKRIITACEFMQGHLAQGFHVEEVAAACNLSSSRLAHLFKQHMGVSPKSWSNNLRLQQARKLLLSSSDSVTTVAQAVGYDDPSQFTRYFKKVMGCSPREFRQSFGGR